MIIERGLVLEAFVVIAKVKPYVVELLEGPVVHLELCSWEAVHEPIYSIVFLYTLVDEAGVVGGDGGRAQRPTAGVVEHVYVEGRIEDAVAEQDRAQRLRLSLNLVRLAEVELVEIVVVCARGRVSACRRRECGVLQFMSELCAFCECQRVARWLRT